MNLLLPSQLATLTPEALIILVTLQQISAVCTDIKEDAHVIPAARQIKPGLDELVAMAPQAYQQMLEAMQIIVDTAVDAQPDQVQVVGPMLSKLPLFVGTAIPKIIEIGQRGSSQAAIFHQT